MTEDMTIQLGGDEYVLRRDGTKLQIGSRRGGDVAWLDTVDAGLLTDAARSALDRGDASDEALVTAVRGIVQGEVERGG